FCVFSSRRRHTRLVSDWSSDVCSSDLQHLHAAGPAGFPGPPRRVDPDVDALHQMLAQEHVVVTEEDGMGTRLGPPDEMRPVPNQGLPALVRRMRLAGDDELHGTLRIGQKTKQAWRVMQQQVRSLVGGEAARKAQRECVGIKEMPGGFDLLGRRASTGQVQRQSLASILYQRLAGGGSKL